MCQIMVKMPCLLVIGKLGERIEGILLEKLGPECLIVRGIDGKKLV